MEDARFAEYAVYVKRFDGSTWNLIPELTGVFQVTSDLVSDGLGNIYLTTRNFDGLDRVSFKHWEETKAKVTDNEGFEGLNPSIALDQTVRPAVSYIAYIDGEDDKIHVKRFGGVDSQGKSRWINVGSAVGDGTSSDYTFAMFGSTPVIAFEENDNLYVKHYAGTSGWVGFDSDVPLDVFTANPISSPSLAVSVSGGVVNPGPPPVGRSLIQPAQVLSATPAIAFVEKDGTSSKIIVKRKSPFKFGPWVQMAGPLNINPAHHAFSPSLVLDGTTPIVAWVEGPDPQRLDDDKLYIARYNDFQ